MTKQWLAPALLLGLGTTFSFGANAQDAVSYEDKEELHDIVKAVEADNIEKDIR